MMNMIKKIKSLWVVLIIFWQKVIDVGYRYIRGIPPLRRSQITADLYLGGQYNLVGLGRLKALGITAIVNMRERSVYSEAQYAGFRYLHLPTVDNTPPKLEDLVRGANFVDHEIRVNKGKVYIHCRQGLGRGPSMAIAYLLKLGTTYDDAYGLVQKTRTFINPRPAQRQRLKELEMYYKERPEEVVH